MNTLIINADQGETIINRSIYGHFAEHLGRCIYEGCWVGEDSPIPNTRGIRNDVVEALKALKPPVLRWPGGCFADEYHWRDGVGPREQRPHMVNTHWGGVTENNHFGTHEFFDLCAMIGADPYVCGNVGSGSVRELREWVEYITFPGRSPLADLRRENGHDAPWVLPFFGVGNESWGCGGNMRPEYYADEFRRYATYIRHLGEKRVFKIACGPNSADYAWTEVLMREASRFMDGLSLHYYTIEGTWKNKGSATDFDEDGWFATLKATLKMDELIRRHGAIMERYDPQKRVALIVDEWGTWWDVEPNTNPGFLFQQNTLRDALVAGLNLHIFNAHADRVRMANIAQTVNALQAMLLTDGPQMLRTPTYHVFEMLSVHQDATLLPVHFSDAGVYERNGQNIPALSVSASKNATNRVHLSVCHTDPNRSAELSCALRGGAALSAVSGRTLSADVLNARNTFDRPDAVQPAPFEGARLENGHLTFTVPPKSVTVLSLSTRTKIP